MDHSFLPSVVAVICLLLFAKLLGCSSEPVTPVVELLNRTSDQACIRWSGVDFNAIQTCRVSYGVRIVNQTQNVIISQLPLSSTVYTLSGLEAANEYSVFVECTDSDGEAHLSEELFIHPVSATSLSPDTAHNNNNRKPPFSNGELHPLSDTSEGPAVVSEDGASSPSDIVLGVVLGLVGAAIIIGVAYHVGKRYRRNLRIRRLLQYRQQDSDPFADMDPDSEQ